MPALLEQTALVPAKKPKHVGNGIVVSERTTSFVTRTDELPVSEQEARAELEKLLADPNFRSTERNRRFLRYVTEKLLEGNAKRIKAYSIAVDVFGRPEDFDPGLDPIVRIEATRLRTSLAHYYAGVRPDHALRIELPRGGYQPVFIRQPTVSAARSRAAFSERPRLLVSIAAGQAHSNAQELLETFLSLISPFQTVTLAPLEKDESFPIPSASSSESLFELQLSFRVLNQHESLGWQLIDRSGDELLASARENLGQEREGDLTLRLAGLTNRLIGRQGVINCRELQRDLAQPTLGHGSLLRAFHGLRTGDAGVQARARKDLEASLRERPSDPSLQAALALLLTALPEPRCDRLQFALELADGAASLDPYSATTAWARAAVHSALKNVEAAELAGQQAVCLNPNDRELLVEIGRLLCLADEWEIGAPLLERAQLLDGSVDLSASLALAAWRSGSLDKARDQLAAHLVDSVSVSA